MTNGRVFMLLSILMDFPGLKGRRSAMKRVAFVGDVLESSWNNRVHRQHRPRVISRRFRAIKEYEDGVPADMPLNRVALYRGIREDRLRRGLLHLTRPCPYRDSAS